MMIFNRENMLHEIYLVLIVYFLLILQSTIIIIYGLWNSKLLHNHCNLATLYFCYIITLGYIMKQQNNIKNIKKIGSNRKKWVYLVKCLFVCFVNLSMIWYIKVVSKYTKDKTIYWTNPWPVSITSPSCPVSPCSSSSSLHWPPWPPPSPARTSGSTLRSLTWVGLTTPDTALGISKLHFKIVPVRLLADAPPGAEPQGAHLGSQRRVLQRVRAQHQVASN